MCSRAKMIAGRVHAPTASAAHQGQSHTGRVHPGRVRCSASLPLKADRPRSRGCVKAARSQVSRRRKKAPEGSDEGEKGDFRKRVCELRVTFLVRIQGKDLNGLKLPGQGGPRRAGPALRPAVTPSGAGPRDHSFVDAACIHVATATDGSLDSI